MAIIQISKIQHRTGANVDLPQLAEGELGFATDERKLYIGNDPALFPPADGNTTTQTEILTEVSTLNYAKIEGSANTVLNYNNVQDGQVVVAQDGAWVNAGGANNQTIINLGDIDNVKILGGVNGYTIQTDGLGNLTWTNSGVLSFRIADISQSKPALVTLQTNEDLTTGAPITIIGVSGMPQIATGGERGTNKYYIKVLSRNQFELYKSANFDNVADQVDSRLWAPANTNQGNVIVSFFSSGTGTSAGANNQIQVGDGAGLFTASGNLTFNRLTNILAVGGNITATQRITANTIVANNTFTGRIGATTPNSGAFTSITASTTANIAGNLTVGSETNILGNLSANNLSVRNFNANGNIEARDITLSGQVRSALIPNANVAYDLGSSTNRWRDIYLSGNTIYLGNQTISATQTGFSFSGTGFDANNLNVSTITASNISGQLTDNSQPNISNVGTLTSLSVAGPVNLGSAANLRLTGGSPNFVLTTRGDGNVAWEPTQIVRTLPGGANTNIQFNDNGDMGGSPSFTFNKQSGIVTGNYSGNGSGLSSITGANVTGQVANALVAGTVYTNAQPNITSVGNLSSLTVNGNASVNSLTVLGNSTITGSTVIAGNLQASNIGNVNLVTANAFVGNGASLSSITGANVTGRVANANYSNFAGTVLTNAQPNITSVGNLVSLGVSGVATVDELVSNTNVTVTSNVFAGNIGTGGDISAVGNLTSRAITSNTTIFAIGNIGAANFISSGNISAQANITTNNLTVSSTLGVTGNTTSGNLIANNSVVASGNITGANLNTTGAVVAIGNISGNNLTATGRLNITGNANVGNLSVTGNITATGNATVQGLDVNSNLNVTGNTNVSNIIATGNISAGNFIGNIRGNVSGNITLPSVDKSIVFSDAGIANGSSAFTFDKNSNVLTVLGNANVGNLRASAAITAIGNITGANIITGGAVSATGNVSAGNLTSSGTLNVTGATTLANANVGNILVSSNVDATNINASGIIGAVGNITAGNLRSNGALNVTGNIIAGRITSNSDMIAVDVTATGNVSANKINANSIDSTGNVTISQTLQAANVIATNRLETTGNLSVGNINATGNIITPTFAVVGRLHTDFNANIGSTLTVAGNATLGNTAVNGVLVAANMQTSGFLDVISNANVGNLRSAGQIAANGHILGASLTSNTTLTVTGNATVNNLVSNGVVQASNIIASNITLNNDASISGNIIVGNNVFTSNVSATRGIFANTLQTSNSITAQGNSTTQGEIIGFGNANITGTVRGSTVISSGDIYANAGIVRSNNATFLSNVIVGDNLSVSDLYATGEGIIGTNLTVANSATVTGTVSGGNLNTGGTLTVTGNATTGNLTVSGNTSISANATVTGNVTAGNIISNGNIDATTGRISVASANISGNLTAGNTVINGNLTVTGATEYSDVTTLRIKDPVIEQGGNVTGALTSNDGKDRGSLLRYHTGAAAVDAFMGWDLSNSEFAFGSNVSLTSDVVSFNNLGNVRGSTFIGNLSGATVTTTGNANVGNVLTVTGVTSLLSNLTVSANATVINKLTAGNIESTSNLTVVIDGSIGNNLSVGANLSAGNISTSGRLLVTGNANVGNLGTSGLITATGNISGGNLTTGGAVNATGSISAGTTLSVTGNANVGNLGTAGLITATGNLTAGNISTGGILTVTGNASAANINVTANINAANLNLTGLANITGNITGGNLTTGGRLTVTGNASTANLTVTGNANISTTVNTSNVAATGVITATGNISTSSNLIVSGNATVANLSSTGVANVTGNLTAGNISTGGRLTVTNTSNLADVNVSSSLAVTGNITGSENITITKTANVGNLRITGNVLGSLLPNANVTYDLGSPTQRWRDIYLANSTIYLGNTTLSADQDSLSASGNLVAGNNISAANTITAANIIATSKANLGSVANVTITGGFDGYVLKTDGAGNLSWTVQRLPGGSNTFVQFNDDGNFNGSAAFTFDKGTNTLSATRVTGSLTTASQPNITSVGTLVSLNVTGNVSAGNLVSSNGITASGEIKTTDKLTVSGNANVGRLVSNDSITATGNITGGERLTITGNATVGNLITSGAITAGSVNFTGLSVTGNANVGNLNATSNIAGNNLSITSNASITGNVSLGNISVTGAAAITGNVNAGNFITTGTITADDINVGNVNSSENISATGNISGANITVTGSVTGATLSITGSGNVSANLGAGNVTVTNRTTTANLTVSTSANLGSVSNVIITGGTNGYVLGTDGSGGLSWVTPNAAAGSNTQVQFNDDGLLGGSSSLTFNKTTGRLTATAFYGSAAGLTSIPGANVTGSVNHAENANIANTISVAAQPNITSVGNLVNLQVNGAFRSKTDAFFEGNVSLVQLSNLTIPGGTANYVIKTDGTGNLSWVALPDVKPGGLDTYVQYNENGNFSGDSKFTYSEATGIVTATEFSGNGARLTSLTGANVTGTVANANYAINSLGSNTANFAQNILAAYGNQSNITRVGVLDGLIINRNNASNINGVITNYDILNIEGYHGQTQGLYVSSDELGITLQTGKQHTGTGLYLFDSADSIGFINNEYLTIQIDSTGAVVPTIGNNAQNLGRRANGLGSITTITGTPAAAISYDTSYILVHNSVGIGTTSGSGTNGVLEIYTRQNNAPFTNQIYQVRIAGLGNGYATGDTITIYGNNLGGTTPANDLTVTITATDNAFWKNLYVNDVIVRNRGSTGPSDWAIVGGSNGLYAVASNGARYLISMTSFTGATTTGPNRIGS